MITYTWNCKTVDVYPLYETHTDVIHRVHWNVTGISDTVDPEGNYYASSTIGTQTLNTGSITTLTPFADLVHADIVDWTKATMGTERVNNIEDSIESQISSSITPTSTTRIVD